MQLGQEKATSWVTCGVKQSFSLLRGNVVCRNRNSNKKILNSIKSCKKVFYSFRQRGIISLVWRHNHLEPIPQTSVSLNLQLQVPPRTPKKPCVIITCKGFFVKRRPIFRFGVIIVALYFVSSNVFYKFTSVQRIDPRSANHANKFISKIFPGKWQFKNLF